ncbi:NAD(P)/FAD-dependent oxidoreductase [Saccharopolyspora gloriosae]|uniref:Cyclohexanone monooxygenase n=1 Tax=Saccharopolyspora gloriosae TaxID=455344 RepID=A0A840NE40_9PSEU|nr:NAD(P)/FAD-dependent oxidoreductase [Saccharopolyspora gloriosae]MBB5069231.1 cyclohexanone monooxygenase [Saccharopolyspora gloriosae]
MRASSTSDAGGPIDVDAVVIGAGFAGLYMLHELRSRGFSVRVLEAGSDVGGTWYWNRYPGARCDIESVDYSYSFSESLQQEWEWSERYPAQPELLRYLSHVADRFDLRRDITFDARVTAAHFDEAAACWTVHAPGLPPVVSRFCIMATGCLSVPQVPELAGLDDFQGPVHHTGTWPESDVDFTGRAVGVIGTGSSGIQSIPVIARQAARLTVFQRTPNFSVPAFNGPLDPDEVREIKANYSHRRRANRASVAGLEWAANEQHTFDVDEHQRRREFENRWRRGGFHLLGAYADIRTDQRANDEVAEFVRGKIREAVHDPATAEALLPYEHPLGSKRVCVDTGYFETYNYDHVALVDLRKSPLETVTARGVRAGGVEHELDALVLATGFDAMTGALNRIDVRGRDGYELAEEWSGGPATYLGLGSAGFPNMFVLAGPGSPSVLVNMVTAIEQHVQWTATCLEHLRRNGYRSIEATEQAQHDWVEHVRELAAETLFSKAASWYLGANVPGKQQVFMPYVGGLDVYEEICEAVAADDYRGFDLE